MHTAITITPLSDHTEERVLQAAGEAISAQGAVPRSRLTNTEAGWRIDGRLANRDETRCIDEMIQTGYLVIYGTGHVIPTEDGIDLLCTWSAHPPLAGATDDTDTRAKFAPRAPEHSDSRLF